jgi:hypothetical protein
MINKYYDQNGLGFFSLLMLDYNGWPTGHTFDEPEKFILFGDPSLRVGGAPAISYQFTVKVTPPGSGSTNYYPDELYSSAKSITLQATANSGWAFQQWETTSASIPTSTNNPYTVTLTENTEFFSVFAKTHTLTVLTTGSGSTNHPSTKDYVTGTTVSVTATATAGWKLDHWEHDGANSGIANPYTVNMNTDHSLKAVFVEEPKGIPGYNLEFMIIAVIICVPILMHKRVS